MRRGAALATALTLSYLCLATGCGLAPREPVPETVELRSYSVAPGYSDSVRGMLRGAFGDSNNVRVTLGPEGRVLVVATPSMHRGVDAFIRELATLGSSPPGPRPVTLRYWLVLGAPAAAGGPAPEIAPALREITPALEEIARTEGPLRFALLERAQLSATGDDRGHLQGRWLRIQQRAVATQDAVIADIAIQVQNYQLETQAKLQPDQLLVLGEVGFDPTHIPRAEHPLPDAETLYYVVSSRLE